MSHSRGIRTNFVQTIIICDGESDRSIPLSLTAIENGSTHNFVYRICWIKGTEIKGSGF